MCDIFFLNCLECRETFVTLRHNSNHMSQETITLPDPPSDWNELSKEQLIYIHSLPRAEMHEEVFKMTVFLYLCNLELCGESFYTPLANDDANDLSGMTEQVKWMESVLDNSADITVVLRYRDNHDAPMMKIGATDLFNAIEAFTEFLDTPFTLVVCPLGQLRIGNHTYDSPAPQMVGLTYEQYTGAQSDLGEIWGMQTQLENYLQQIQSIVQEADKRKKEPIIPRELTSAIEELQDGMKHAQAHFCAYVLTVMQAVVDEVEEYDADGNVKMVKGKIKKTLHSRMEAKKFDSVEADRLADEIYEHAPSWLFPILHQWFQGSLAAQQKLFPKLFSGKKGGGESNPLVANIATLNTLMKEQGYHDQQAVLDANAIFNFKKLDDLTRQAEEMERMNKKMKRKK